jgi:hypothetical protein
MKPSTFLLATLIAMPLAAHDLYLMPQKFAVKPGETILVSVHVGDSFPASESAADPWRLIDGKISGGAPLHDYKVLGRTTYSFATVDGAGSRFATVHTEPNGIELPAKKFESYLVEEGQQAVIEWRKEHAETDKPGREAYSKFAKALITSGAPDDGYAAVLGLPIEIVLEANPVLLGAGELLPVRVLWRSRPAACLQLEASWTSPAGNGTRIIGRTDAQGRLLVPLDTVGKWRLHTVAMERCTNPDKADWESYWASLTFEVPADGKVQSRNR